MHPRRSPCSRGSGIIEEEKAEKSWENQNTKKFTMKGPLLEMVASTGWNNGYSNRRFNVDGRNFQCPAPRQRTKGTSDNWKEGN